MESELLNMWSESFCCFTWRVYNQKPGCLSPIQESGFQPGESIPRASDMPVYEYQCETCQLRFEKLQRFSDSSLTECPNCGGPVHRVMQPVGVIFKGSGFYVTDNRGKSSTMPPTKREGEGKSAEGEGKSEGKSAEGVSSAPPVGSAPKAVDGQSSRTGEQ